MNSMIRYLISSDRGEASGWGLLGFFFPVFMFRLNQVFSLLHASNFGITLITQL